MVSGGAGGTRTPYLFNAIEALSQMSYSPKLSTRRGRPSARQYSKGPWFRQGRDAWTPGAAPRCAAAEVPYPLALARLRPSAI